MSTTDKSIFRTSENRLLAGRRWIPQLKRLIIGLPVLAFPLIVLGQAEHAQRQSHSWVHWLITIVLVAAIVWVVVRVVRRRKG